jgi:hypothetical protein
MTGLKDKESATDAQIPLLPFDPRTTGPLDLLRSGVGRVRGFCSANSRELLAAGTIILVAQMAIYAHYGHWFLSLPQLPNWLLVGIAGIVVMLIPGPLFGVLLAKGLYKPNVVRVSVQNPQTGDQRIKYMSRELFDSMDVVTPNGKRGGSDLLSTVSLNGFKAYEVDHLDRENGLLVASSMAGRSNSDIRRDRKEIRNIKTEQQQKIDEATELKILYPDHVRSAAMKIANRAIRSIMDVSLPDGASLHDELQESIENIDVIEDLDDDDETESDEQAERDAQSEAELEVDPESLVGIFGRAAAGTGDGTVSADD